MNWLRNFMMGRYGPDSLSLFLIVVSLVCTLTSSLFGGVLVLILISYALWFWGYLPDALPQHCRPAEGERDLPPGMEMGDGPHRRAPRVV